MRSALLASLLLVSTPGFSGDAERIVGTWKLVSVLYEDAQTKERWPVLGAHPAGIQIVTPEGRWRLEDGKVVTRVEAAWNEAWVGTEQIRAYRFEGNLLQLESPPTPHPNLAGR